MKRLQHALESFSPSGSLGLRSKREMTYELVPPTDSKPNYTAQVTVTSKTFFESEYLPPEKIKKKEKEFDAAAYNNILEDDPFADPLSIPDQQFSELSGKDPIIGKSSVSMPRLDEQEVFELAYLDGKWQLVTEPESKSSQNWFNYALQNYTLQK